MAVDLADYVETLKREVTPPGSSVFSNVSEEVWVGHLADAFWEARLDGFLSSWEANEDGIVTPTVSGGAELPRDRVALLVLYAGIRILRIQILNTNTAFRAVAGPVEFETQNSATMLKEMLQQLERIKGRLLEQASAGGTPTYLIDGYSVRNWSDDAYYGEFLSSLYAGMN